MKRVHKKENAKLLTMICLTSLDVDQNFIKGSNVKRKNISGKHKNTLIINHKTIYSNLLIAWHVLSLSAKQKEKVVSILKNCSSGDNSSHEEGKKRSKCKYLRRFKYKYQQRHNRSLKFEESNQFRMIDKYNLIGIIALYCVYKILKAKSKFSACRKFKRQAVNYKPALSK